jgi:hypothetical protein
MRNRIHALAFATLATLLAPTGVAVAEGKHAAVRGGVFVEGKEADYELVAKPTLVQLYITDHGKAKDLSKASAQLTLLSGADKQDVALKPAGDRLEATGTFKVGPGTKVVAVVSDGGKTLGTARFTLK